MNELSKTYEPDLVEDRWIDFWLQNKIFSPDKNPDKKAFSIVIPPPNVTGSLHMGHALNSTIQDILARYHRMKGDNTLWVVGTDHAGIATQNVVERQLKEEGKTRFDLGREAFVERVWKWRHESGGTIIGQLKKLGASCDYDHERFTMDEGLSNAVKKVFVQLYNEGLIYRGERLINWCPRCQTALSDLEVEHSEHKGSLWHIRYELTGGASGAGGHLIVATTRPETLLGDTAVAVNPQDERYKHLIGKKVKLPLTDREIPVIADDYVDREFGSGVVKITPAHDFNDFAVGERHKLEKINILTPDGKLNEKGEAYKGLNLTEARKKVVADLEAQELIDHIDAHTNRVGACYRCKATVEPYLSDQWFVKTQPLAEKAMEAVRSGQTRFVPQHWEKTYFNWMENITDWCISRQIWWGHQIPAWYCKACGSDPVAPHNIIVSETIPTKCPTCGGTNLKQDEDVLDTWFSSALWPFSTLGWPEAGEHAGSPLQMFYPTSTLVTAFDIIFFWVARMMMFGIHFMKEVPFKDVHIHALVRDPMGQKMSKSKGNVVDPLLMMKKYGTDAFRFTLAAFAAQGRDIKLDETRIEGYRHFCNKIWNASRFAMMNASNFVTEHWELITPKERINQWILTELAEATKKTIHAIENYEFNTGAHALYAFFWNSFCDWYIELSKEVYKEGTDALKQETANTTYFVLDTALRLMHPFMPFITEEIWQMLKDRKGATIALSAYPGTLCQTTAYKKSWQEVALLIQTATAIRSIRQESGLPANQLLPVFIRADNQTKALFTDIIPLIKRVARVEELNLIESDYAEAAAVARLGSSLLFIPLKGLINLDKETARLDKKKQKIEKDVGVLNKSLEDPNFVQNASTELIAEKKQLLAEATLELDIIVKAQSLIKGS